MKFKTPFLDHRSCETELNPITTDDLAEAERLNKASLNWVFTGWGNGLSRPLTETMPTCYLDYVEQTSVKFEYNWNGFQMIYNWYSTI